MAEAIAKLLYVRSQGKKLDVDPCAFVFKQMINVAKDMARKRRSANSYIDDTKSDPTVERTADGIDEKQLDLQELGPTIYELLHARATANDDPYVVVFLEACANPNLHTPDDYRKATGMTEPERWAAERRLETLVSHLPKHLLDAANEYFGETQ